MTKWSPELRRRRARRRRRFGRGGDASTVREQGEGEGETARGLTAVAVGVEAGSGTRWRRRIRRRRWSEPEEGNGDVAAMQGFRGLVERWGGRGSCGGASELLGGARGGRSQWLRRTAATVCFGRERERAREKRGRVSESRGDRDGLRASSTRPGGRWQAGGGRAAVRARRPHAWPTGARRTTAVVGWAGLLGRPAGWAAQGGAQVSSSCYFFFCFLISDICFDLNNILNHLFNLCQFLQELYILYQSSFINGIIFGHILIYIINIFPMQIIMH